MPNHDYKFRLPLDLKAQLAPTDRNDPPSSLPREKTTKYDPKSAPKNASIYFVGTATTIIEFEGIRLMTDPNFLHSGDHVHLGPGVTATRVTNPAVDLEELPTIDAVLLSHYHEDHFDRKVEDNLRRGLPIITTPHAKAHLIGKEQPFTSVHALDAFESGFLPVVSLNDTHAGIRVTAMPGKHVPQGFLSAANDLLGAVPPTNGWILELGYGDGAEELKCGYRIYITGDTLMVDELKEIPKRYTDEGIDLMLAHLGGTTIPGKRLPLLMVTMDAIQGVQLIQLINPDVTIPIHYDDYDVFASPLEDFKKKVVEAGLESKVVYLDRGDAYKFGVTSST